MWPWPRTPPAQEKRPVTRDDLNLAWDIYIEKCRLVEGLLAKGLPAESAEQGKDIALKRAENMYFDFMAQ